ncbi:MAG: DUF454 family protein [Gammaproteobacteria bacterium]|nr:DUF454 family protein [Gammaproteobacteria bacterium]MBT3859850.1 DUF454 family protein [Gammaproteobacteria bacterium]MBT3988496.1 DUF454 family protein [Gammaproteobacteria bacterium]MBT4254929.1 DUF454 family protein [Gammaproteobacteria bacterium]MBT4583165.1 DUF454 family protein [Gammaproteobacteria bacterium]
MNYKDYSPRRMPLIAKIILVFMAICFAVIGLIGLILPIIPGILFLFLALFVLSQVSSRFARFLHNNPSYRGMKSRLKKFDFDSALRRAELGFWKVIKSVLDFLDRTSRGFSDNK